MEPERKPKAGGRKSLLTPERQQTILDLIAAGNYIDTATKASGISHQTLSNWLSRGTAERERLQANPNAEPDPKEHKYLEFLEESEKAFAIAEARNMAIIQRAAHDGTWQAAAWILERTRGKRYQRVDKSEISGPEGGPLRINVSTEELERKVSKILEKRESA
jgi:transposase